MSQPDIVKNKTSQAVVSSGSLSSKRWPKYLIWLVALIVLVVIIVVVVALVNRSTGDDNSGNNISGTESSLLTKAATAISNRDYDQLDSVVGNITKQPDYQKDPNYLYVLATYHIGINDPTVAEGYLRQLNKVYDSSTGYAEPLQQVTTATPAKQLTKQAESMQTSKGQSVNANVLGDSGAPKN